MFPTTLDAPALAEALKIQGLSEAQAIELHAEAYDLLDLAFADRWREPTEAIGNSCMIRVARSLREGSKAANAGQLAKTNNADRVASARAHADPIESVRHILARYVVPL